MPEFSGAVSTEIGDARFIFLTIFECALCPGRTNESVISLTGDTPAVWVHSRLRFSGCRDPEDSLQVKESRLLAAAEVERSRSSRGKRPGS